MLHLGGFAAVAAVADSCRPRPTRSTIASTVFASTHAPSAWLNRVVLAGQRLGIKEVDEGIWLVSFMSYDLGYIELELHCLKQFVAGSPHRAGERGRRITHESNAAAG